MASTTVPGPDAGDGSVDPLPLADAQVAARLRTCGPELWSEALACFAGELPGTAHDVALAFAAGNAAGVARLAHHLKGSAATLGAQRIAQALTAVEAACRAGDLAAAALAWQRVGDLREATLAALRQV